MTMSTQVHMDFFSRAMLQYSRGVSRTLPKEYNVEIDRETFLKSFKFKIGDESVNPTPWPLGPTGSVHDQAGSHPDIEEARAGYLEVLYSKLAPGIPSASSTHPLVRARELGLSIHILYGLADSIL